MSGLHWKWLETNRKRIYKAVDTCIRMGIHVCTYTYRQMRAHMYTCISRSMTGSPMDPYMLHLPRIQGKPCKAERMYVESTEYDNLC